MPRTVYVAFVTVVLFSMVLFTACGKQAESPIETPQASQEDASQETTVSRDDVKKEAAEALEAAKAYTQQQKDVYQKKIEDRINELDNELSQLRARAQASSAETKSKLDAEIEELEEKGRTAREKLAEMRDATDQKWKDLKLELDEMLTSLEERLNDLLPPME
jgi:membrane-associated HD superfamily phosphohydrolase